MLVLKLFAAGKERLTDQQGAAAWAGFGTYFEPNPTIQWRLLVALQCVAPLILLLGSPWIPESPRWLINRKRDQQGNSGVSWLRCDR
jgi:hypothetical protein